jgi:membrane protease YdiL (CAAX protease family)
MIESVWLVLVLAALAAWTLRGNREYAVFRTLTDERLRSRYYLRWTAESFVLLSGASLVTLLMLGRPDALLVMPDVFRPLATHFTHEAPTGSTDGMIHFVVGVAIGLSIVAALYCFRLRKLVNRDKAVTGDIEPLLPRTARERLAAIPLCLNAGFSEELFFRLVLPLLATHVTGSAAIGFALALVVFGLVHSYQGWKGIAATTLFGGVLTAQYLSGASLVWLIAIHAIIDLANLVVCPALADRLDRRRAVA